MNKNYIEPEPVTPEVNEQETLEETARRFARASSQRMPFGINIAPRETLESVYLHQTLERLRGTARKPPILLARELNLDAVWLHLLFIGVLNDDEYEEAATRKVAEYFHLEITPAMTPRSWSSDA